MVTTMRKIILVPALVLAAIVIFSLRLVMLAVGSAIYVYLFPWVVADKRDHPRRNEILFVCAVSAWLVIPWIAALWVATKAPDAEPAYIDGDPAWNASDD